MNRIISYLFLSAWVCGPASAATITNTFSVDVNSLFTFESTDVNTPSNTGLPVTIFFKSLGSAFTPFTVNTGDTVITQVNFTGGAFSLQDFGSPALGDDEFAVVSYSNGIESDFTFSRTSTMVFQGVSGDINSGVSFSSSITNNPQSWPASIIGDITGSVGSFTGFTITTFFDSVTQPGVQFNSATMFFSQDTPVPEPGGILLGLLGLIGMAAIRKPKARRLAMSSAIMMVVSMGSSASKAAPVTYVIETEVGFILNAIGAYALDVSVGDPLRIEAQVDTSAAPDVVVDGPGDIYRTWFSGNNLSISINGETHSTGPESQIGTDYRRAGVFGGNGSFSFRNFNLTSEWSTPGPASSTLAGVGNVYVELILFDLGNDGGLYADPLNPNFTANLIPGAIDGLYLTFGINNEDVSFALGLEAYAITSVAILGGGDAGVPVPNSFLLLSAGIAIARIRRSSRAI